MAVSGTYDTALVCPNGHVVNGGTRNFPYNNKKFCPKCGEASVSKCTKCASPVQGNLDVPGALIPPIKKGPSFCHECGHPFPWTDRRLQAAIELAGEVENLDKKERELLTKSLDDIIRDTANTPTAAARFKRLMGKVSKESAIAFRDLLVDIASETARKAIWG